MAAPDIELRDNGSATPDIALSAAAASDPTRPTGYAPGGFAWHPCWALIGLLRAILALMQEG